MLCGSTAKHNCKEYFIGSMLYAKANIIYFEQSKDLIYTVAKANPTTASATIKFNIHKLFILTVSITKSPCEYLYESLTLGTLARRENCFILSARVL